jgi:hypothetical protein
MFLVLSLFGFVLALGVFVYLFDHFMGASDTADLASTMAAMREESAPNETRKTRRLRAAA